jgi:hypothetical protein
MKITKQRLKEIIKEELRETLDGDGALDAAVRNNEFARRAKEMAMSRRETGRPETDASTTNLDRFDPSDPDEESTLEMTKEEWLAFRANAAEELKTTPEDPSLWEKILDAVRRANVFEDPRRGR